MLRLVRRRLGLSSVASEACSSFSVSFSSSSSFVARYEVYEIPEPGIPVVWRMPRLLKLSVNVFRKRTGPVPTNFYKSSQKQISVIIVYINLIYLTLQQKARYLNV